MEKTKALLKNLDEIIITIMLVIVCVVLIMQVFFRFVLNSPLIWSEELARYLFIWLTMLGLSYNVRTDNNISMTLIVSKMPKEAQKILSLGTDLIGIAVFVYLFPAAVIHMKSQVNVFTNAMRLPMVLLVSSVPIGFGLTIIQLILHFVRTLRSDKYKNN
ncbi:MAG: TRAP transporter small permease [Eubacteriales bacterium]|nr:TRAP transporter small permease [Eubacteriales bacterium]